MSQFFFAPTRTYGVFRIGLTPSVRVSRIRAPNTPILRRPLMPIMPSVPIEGGKTAFRSLLWWCWKNFQILARSHLSHFFALFLGVAVVIREWEHLVPIAKFEHF